MGFASTTPNKISRNTYHTIKLTPHRPHTYYPQPLYSIIPNNEAAINSFNEPLDPSYLPIVLFSILLFALAQSFINSMLEGERGLGAFLSDGRGFKKSGFRTMDDAGEKNDPLPWLKLPELDFVDVAGQEKGNVTAASSQWE